MRSSSIASVGRGTLLRNSTFHGTTLTRCRPPAPSGLRATLSVEAGLIGYGKKWEKLPVNKNNNVEKVKMHVRKGDHVIIIAGSEKGKTGDITRVCRKTGKVWLEGTNMKLRFKAPEKEKDKATTYRAESPMHFSNVMHYSEEQQVRSRVKKQVIDGKRVRVLVKTGEVLPN